MESHLDQLVSCILSLYLLLHLGRAAPGLPGAPRETSADASPSLFNPFGSGEEGRQPLSGSKRENFWEPLLDSEKLRTLSVSNLVSFIRGMHRLEAQCLFGESNGQWPNYKLLKSYIQSSLQNSQGGPEISSWEQEVFFLFRLYDFDRSGFLDGLEMMKLLSDYNSHHAPGAAANELVVSMVDFLLQTHDLNQDGLLDPSELLSPSVIHTQASINRTPQQQQEVPVVNVPSNSRTEEENVVEHREEAAHEELRPQMDDQAQQEVFREKEEPIKQTDQHNEEENHRAPAGEWQQVHDIPLHQGQPEI